MEGTRVACRGIKTAWRGSACTQNRINVFDVPSNAHQGLFFALRCNPEAYIWSSHALRITSFTFWCTQKKVHLRMPPISLLYTSDCSIFLLVLPRAPPFSLRCIPVSYICFPFHARALPMPSGAPQALHCLLMHPVSLCKSCHPRDHCRVLGSRHFFVQDAQ